MNRKIKNVIIIAMIIIVAILSFFTMNHAKNSIGTPNNMMEKSDMGAPPEIPSGMQEENNQNENADSNSMGEPPARPDGENSSNGQMGEPNENRPENMPNMDKMNSQNVKLTTTYYIAFVIEGLILAILVIYLIMSNFNKKSIKETIKDAKRILIYSILVILLTIALIFLQIYITNTFFLSSNNENQNNDSMPAPGNMNSGNSDITYTANKEITESEQIDSQTFSSTTKDENAVLANGDIDVTLSNSTIKKEGDSDGGDTTSFYGTNSAILAKSGSNLTLKNITVTTDATGANGVFSYGGSATTNNSSSDGTIVTISDSKITTQKDNSGGIMTTGGGTMKASNLTVNTAGTSSAAIRTDRGGGIVTVDNGTYTTTGQGSPTIYSTADVTVNNSTLNAEASEGIVIEGKNSVTINNCNLTDSNTKLNGQSTTYKNIFLYQSMSGDASTGTSKFTANSSKITTNKGDTFYVTNTSATITLSNNIIINNDSTGNFLRVQKDSWGEEGTNGGNVTLTMNTQEAKGNIVIDSISTLSMELKSDSYYEGIINGDNSAKSISLKLDSSSKIKLTGDSYVTEFEDSDTSYSNIDFNGYKLYVNGNAIN